MIVPGASDTNYTAATVKTSTSANTQVQPFLHFPSFDTSSAETIFPTGGWLTWQGTQISRGFLPLGSGAPPADKLGLDSGPVVLFDGASTGNSKGDHAMIISPATHFKGAVQFMRDRDWVAGVSGEVTKVPAGFTHETILHATGLGITTTIEEWGFLMREAYNTTKVADKLVTHIGYA
jgi:hypothetical protein